MFGEDRGVFEGNEVKKTDTLISRRFEMSKSWFFAEVLRRSGIVHHSALERVASIVRFSDIMQAYRTLSTL